MEEVKENLYVLPLRLLEESSVESSSSSNPVDAVIFVRISLVLGIASRHLLRGTRGPHTVALLIIGIEAKRKGCGGEKIRARKKHGLRKGNEEGGGERGGARACCAFL
ncbi:sodium/hydrogen exchanger 7 [Corchorus capsularis]|uniref:Sodium/hydrogen exchanger 7 n=1 Tax=Corchorus capsularis TaxID=210143 RepID=A0A1R3JU66_COCAP|nr:sodium/hydrogen exchanger 7 [Corchorus capsularis]